MSRHPEERKVRTRLLIWCSLLPAERSNKQHGPLAQSVEQWTFNPLVAGSSPARPTTLLLKSPPNLLLKSHRNRLTPDTGGSLYILPTTLTRLLPRAVSVVLSEHVSSDDASETAWRLTAPLTLLAHAGHANETASRSLEAPSTLPEYDVEVVA